MAQYSHLPIYNKAFSILRELYVRVPKFSKQYKYFLGGELIKYSIESVKLIRRANKENDKKRRTDLIEKLCLSIEMIIIHLRIANELRQLGGQGSYLYMCELAVDLSKQAEGWKKYIPLNFRQEMPESAGLGNTISAL